MPNLDGTDVIKPVAFDAHEQATRGEHIPTSAGSPDKDPATVAEFPKAIDHVDHPSGVGKEPVVAESADHEAELKAAAAEVKPAAEVKDEAAK